MLGGEGTASPVPGLPSCHSMVSLADVLILALVIYLVVINCLGFTLNPGWSLGQEDPPGEGNSYTLQYPCLESSMNRGAWWAI